VPWTVARTEPQREHVADRWLGEQSFQTYLPRVRITHHLLKPPRTIVRLMPLFPSYIFVLEAAHWQPILRTVAVVELLMNGERPGLIGDAVVAELRSREGPDGVVRLSKASGFRRGEKLRIVRGPLSGHMALYQDQLPHERIAVLLALFGGERRVELPRQAVMRMNGAGNS
jgi:transcription antitermination factor NusG